MLQARDILANFRRHFGQEFFGCRIHLAREHEVLPDHQAEFIAQIVKPVRLVAAAAPDAQHVHVRVDGRLQQIAHVICRDAPCQCVGRYPVCALAEHAASIDLNSEAAADVIGLADQPDLAQADAACQFRIAECDRQRVERLFTLAGRPPQSRIVDLEPGGQALAGRVVFA